MPISLRAITIFNFKSFRGEIEFPCIPPFTVIVGPNGSGKSNIADAISFVMGEEELQALRVTHLRELIYGASIGEPIADSAHVTAAFIINNDERKNFTRRIYRNNNQYKIDDQIVTFKVYMMKLEEYGFNIKLRNFMVYQGFVEHIAMKMPKELTVMFEQFSGSNIYKRDYERLKMEFAKVKDEVHSVYLTKKQANTEKNSIMAEKAEAEKYLMLQSQYTKHKLRLQYIQLFLIERTIRTLQDKKRNMRSAIDKHLDDKDIATVSFQQKISQFKSLSNSFQTSEEDILRVKNAICKKMKKYTIIKENILHWLKKRNYARISLDNASKACDTRKRTIQELKDEVEQVNGMLLEVRETLQQNVVELSNSQVKHYLELKNKTEFQAKSSVEQINCLIRNRQIDQNKYDNMNRAKQEPEIEIKRKTMTKEELEKHLEKLHSLSNDMKATLTEKTVQALEKRQKLGEAENKSVYLKNKIAEFSEKLREADIDKCIISQEIKKTETIKFLKQSFPGVHGRLSDLCKPTHKRYNIAVTKAFGKNIDAIVVDNSHTAMQCIGFLKSQQRGIEIFLPLDSLRVTPLMEHLRAIKEPSNVKLLYDVLDISSTKINNAVLFVTKNTLVSETAEDARIVAYKMDKRTKYDCVSLDGCFYRKDGIISGGQVDLIIRAKRWETEQMSILTEQKTQLTRELKDLPNTSLMQSELNDLDIEIKELDLRIKYIEINIKSDEDNIVKIHEELITHGMELSVLNEAISKIQHNIRTKDAEIADIEKYVKAIENEIFVDFCRDINVPNITYYERNNLRIHQEQERKLLDLEKQYDRIQEQLHFENERDTESKISKWRHIIEQADINLGKKYEQDRSIKTIIAQEETSLSILQNNCVTIKKNLVEVEREMTQFESEISNISKLYLRAQSTYILLQREIEQGNAEHNAILEKCKMEGIIIPLLSERLQSRSELSISTSSPSLNVESSNGWETSCVVDFSQLPEDIRNNTEENLWNISKELEQKLVEIKNKLQAISNPNLKTEEKVNSITQQIQEINKKYKETCKKRDTIEAQFQTIKENRYKMFMDCLEHVAAEIDPIYKALVDNTVAQAFILPDNTEEPYEGGINYTCIVPFKRFQLLQDLSGGEKTVASLALLFAFHRCKPFPFFVMDEVDAALDEANRRNLFRFIQSQASNVSFIIISLHYSSHSYANMLIGVTTEPDSECFESAVYTLSLDGYRPANSEML